ncbi:MAG: urease accessory protein [Candidatus Binatia bacterium]
MTLAATFTLGFLLGVRHALDADHLAAVATLATRSRSLAQTVAQGVAWGTGHTLTLMLVGGVVLAAGAGIPARAAEMLELGVGVMLVVLGADALGRLWRERVHVHVHRHGDGAAHVHAHAHRGEPGLHDPVRHEHAPPRRLAARAMLVGMMHGMAGSAALVLLGLQAVRSPAWAFAYIAVFGGGSIVGMLLLSAAIAVPLRWSSHHLGRAHSGLSAAVGLATLVLGCFIVYGIQSQ